MTKFFKTKFFKKRVFDNTFKWKNFGLYYSLPIFYRKKLKFPELKLSYCFRGYYYEKVVEDNIYSYSSGFQKDSFERLKTISMIKKHRRLLWVNDRNEYLSYTLCDMLKVSYKDNNVLRFVMRYKIINTDLWMFNFFPRKNYKHFISAVLRKERLIYFCYKTLKLIKKKLYSFFKGNKKAFFRKKDRIFLIKIIWTRPKTVFLTTSGYRFIKTGLRWLNLGVFTGLFFIIKGNAKKGVLHTLLLTNAMFIYYNNLFIRNIKNVEIYFSLLLYTKLYQYITIYILESTYKSQKIKFRRSNRLLRKFHRYYSRTFSIIQFKFFNYFKTIYLFNFENLKVINNYFLYSKYFEYLNNFENSLFKDRNKLFFVKNYTLKEKVLIFKTIVYLLQFDLYRTKVRYLTLKNFYNYFTIKSDVFYLISGNKIKFKPKLKFLIFNQFCFEGFILNNFIFNIYLNFPLSRRRRVWKFFFIGKKKKILIKYKKFKGFRSRVIFLRRKEKIVVKTNKNSKDGVISYGRKIRKVKKKRKDTILKVKFKRKRRVIVFEAEYSKPKSALKRKDIDINPFKNRKHFLYVILRKFTIRKIFKMLVKNNKLRKN